LLLPLSQVHFQHFHPLCCCARWVCCLLFSVFVWWGRGVSLPWELCWFIPRSGWGNSTWCVMLTCLFCRMCHRQVWSWHSSGSPALLAVRGLQLLSAFKGWFVGQSLNFFLHLMWWWLLFWLEAVRITQVWLQLHREVLESWRLGFLLPYPSRHLGSSCFEMSLQFIHLLYVGLCFNSSHLVSSRLFKSDD
jgi:hypothetical protein